MDQSDEQQKSLVSPDFSAWTTAVRRTLSNDITYEVSKIDAVHRGKRRFLRSDKIEIHEQSNRLQHIKGNIREQKKPNLAFSKSLN